MARLSNWKKNDRDILVQRILDSAKELYERNLVRGCDIVVDQDDMGPNDERTGNPMENLFYSGHKDCDVRINVVLVVRAMDR